MEKVNEKFEKIKEDLNGVKTANKDFAKNLKRNEKDINKQGSRIKDLAKDVKRNEKDINKQDSRIKNVKVSTKKLDKAISKFCKYMVNLVLHKISNYDNQICNANLKKIFFLLFCFR